MSSSTFRIESVSIEGFKAFTKRQTFDFGSRHIFLFGPNGLGKTSIVEAIRWCLFGLASRPGELVKNQFYGGPCIVQMTLIAADGQWTMQRRLRPSGGESDQTVRDPSGSERNLEEVFPQLSRIGPREGTHVIYAAQQPSSRRPEADITDFSHVVYRYLGLEEVPRLSDMLLALSRDWKIQEDEICQEVEALGESFSQRLAEVEENLSRITSDPPWGNSLTPTNPDTRDKINQLVRDANALGAECSIESLDGLAPQDKLYEVETAIRSLLTGELAGLTQLLTEKSGQLKDAESLLEAGKSAKRLMEEQCSIRDNLQAELDLGLNGSQLENLQDQLLETETDLKSTQLKLAVVRSSLKYLEEIDDGNADHNCPTCEADILLCEVTTQLEGSEASGDCETTGILERRDQLRDQITTCTQLSAQIQDVANGITQHKNGLAEVLEKTEQTCNVTSPASIDSLGEYVEELRKDYKNLEDALDTEGKALKDWEARIDNSRQEVRFHQQRLLMDRLQRLYDVRYEALHSSLKDLADLRDIADQTRLLLNCQLQERLRTALPPVAQEMTEVYLRLTGKPTFDSIEIRQGESTDGSMTLDLRVSSSRGPGTWGVEQGILNGQALNAIQLVPYFVFSRYQEDPLLDLLLLDDPTQAFDTNKINLLLTELADAASHATLFLATHEEDRFLPVLKDFFPPSDVKAYKAVGIDHEGPQFEDVSIPL